MSKLASKGTVIEFSRDDFTTSFALTCQVGTWTGPASTTQVFEADTLCIEPVEKIPGSVSYDDFTIVGFFDPDDAAIQELQAIDLTNEVMDWRIVWTNNPATTTRFTGFVNALGVAGGTTQAIALNLGVSVSSVIWDDVP